jgi:formylglycine-generating enzyme required for sulfatase activity
LKTAIFMTIISGIAVGVILLLIEYVYFIPFFIPTQTPIVLPTDHNSKPCTPGEIFRDRFLQGSGLGPEMVVIPAGRFRMGDIQGGGSDWEQPVHSVFVNGFAIGRYEVTFAEYDHFAQATDRKKPSDYGWGRGNRPVINVSWKDAIAYTEWLSQQTSQQYRLPTEAEWEYAARADTEMNYWWGNRIGSNRANCDGCGSQWDNNKTAPVGSFAPNPFNLYDTVGNVYEWTCSGYRNKYNGKEQRCSGKYSANTLRSIRGGSWYSLPAYVRSASRSRSQLDSRELTIGFRIARTM